MTLRNEFAAENEDLRQQLAWPNGGFCPALQGIDWHISHSTLLHNMTNATARRTWGKEFAHGIAYRSARQKRMHNRPVKYRVELSVRTSGAVLQRMAYTIKKDGREIAFGWGKCAAFKVFSHEQVIALAATWQDLGYMVTVHKAKWVEAEMALALLRHLNLGD